MRIPKHIGVIPDGNRRWALKRGLSKEKGYDYGVDPGIELIRLCKKMGVEELTFYGFTMDNTKRTSEQTKAFTNACIQAANGAINEGSQFLVVGDTESPMFPEKLIPYTSRKTFGDGNIKVNLLVNYGWQWDLKGLKNLDNKNKSTNNKKNIMYLINSKEISRIDLIIRWGGRRRLSGFLPVQSVYSDFYVVDNYWPDFKPKHLNDAIDWYDKQDITLGG
ncbi:Di-trans-poly-cis-decaprenylcistransferase [Methanohalobium evestigatum Z-7303]|uniref:Di-trans-poly-cis-decaprenylcistransferase n=1 Tax=Methanohalobium evestigatum (strain ATCC BAA-1072 / DSM 3721 / NBRC 107634 / OCM 161 / Z-7303) TaxID=644295 RepID=D7EAS8_METEZ|nr:polyprenyl diphosphate synthase [Methanohalobium evestigatum]ADI74445.1 Di-trans-poly-cis-decaprenylcistransferase [Methanohalobium evestigatum Z-7303]